MTQALFKYMNYRGEAAFRTVEVVDLRFLARPFLGHQPGWHLHGIDVERGLRRSFALSHIMMPEYPDEEMVKQNVLFKIPLL